MAGAKEVSTNRFGLGPVTLPEKASVQVQVMGVAKMVHGSMENVLDLPWHLRASITSSQRWFFSGATTVSLWQASAGAAAFS